MSVAPSQGGPDQPTSWPAPAPPPPPSQDWYGTYPPPAPERSRTPIYVALFIVAVLSGSALFMSGFTLGLQQSLSPGTAANDQELFDPFWEAYHKIAAEYVGTYEPKALVEGAIGGMFRSLGDPYSSYMTSEEYSNSLSGLSGEFEGIGATMTAVDASGQVCDPIGAGCPLKVVSVTAGSPAEKGGLLPGDQITAVDGKSVTGATMEETVTRVRGPRDTDVTLSIIREGQPRDLRLTRGVIKIEDVEARLVAGRTVGYLRIVGFSGSAADSFRTHLKEQLDAGVRGFVIDVRDDPGGYVDAALSIASQFVGSGPIYWEEYADGRQVPTEARSDGLATDPGIRVVVLVNGGSASASEILAGALQDTGRAMLVGGRTFGKGTIQQWHLLSGSSGGFRLSVAKWLTPNKTWVHGTGIEPNVPVTVPDGTPEGEDPQLDRALEVLATKPAGTAGAGASPGHPALPSGEATPSASLRPSGVPLVGWTVALRATR
jgi:carboxyl-terminal processing protease